MTFPNLFCMGALRGYTNIGNAQSQSSLDQGCGTWGDVKHTTHIKIRQELLHQFHWFALLPIQDWNWESLQQLIRHPCNRNLNNEVFVFLRDAWHRSQGSFRNARISCAVCDGLPQDIEYISRFGNQSVVFVCAQCGNNNNLSALLADNATRRVLAPSDLAAL